MKTTLGDVTGDNVEDVVVYYVGTGMSVDVISKGKQQTIAQTLNIGSPARDAVIRFASGPQILLWRFERQSPLFEHEWTGAMEF